ncbi:AsmA family protein [Parvularcula lutaonensis]|uniref:AsmA family protein n=1 Tax=Parvularcula lutaonensis TaxID=491923 RepID=A0ABV7M7Y1_9PROT|nr:AsmA family protein [Parvularcula lutaonensis]GGY43101.1 hypothetical protein GCM10007148_09760 [Parvularcula lutaonensis]
MKWLLRIGIGLVVLMVVGVLLVPMFIDKDDLLRRAEAQVSETLNRQVSIGGISGVSLFPARITISDLSVASGDGFAAENLVTVSEAQLGVALWPLLSGRVEIQRFVLTEPVIALEQRADGSNNWTLGQGAGDAPPGEQETGEPEQAPIVGTIEVIDGTVAYTAPDASYRASDVDMVLVLPELGDALQLGGTMALEGVPTRVGIQIADPWRITAEKASAIGLDIELGGNTIKGDADVVLEPLTIRGPLEIRVPNLRALTPLLGEELVASADSFSPMELSGIADATAQSVAFETLRFSTALASGTGDLNLDLSGAKPMLTGNVTAGEVDLRPFFPEGTGEPAPDADEPFPAWSEEEMDFSGIDAANAAVDVAAGRIILPTYELTNVKAAAALTNGLARFNLQNAEAFGGTAAGAFTLDARQAMPRITSALNFANVDFARAAPALLSTKRLTGRGTIHFDMTTSGASEAAWVRNLDGTANADIADGAIAGINLSTIATTGLALVQELRQDAKKAPAFRTAINTLRTEAIAPGAMTRFDLADFDVTVVDGYTQLGEAKLVSDTFRGTISGGINLPAQSLDLKIRVAAKAPSETAFREFRIPIVVTGSFSDPEIALDPDPLIQELVRGVAADALSRAGIDVPEGQDIEGALRERAATELRNLLGRRRPAQPAEPADTAQDTEEPAGEASTDGAASDSTGPEEDTGDGPQE